MDFDLMILGGGPAGYVAAARAARGGLKSALVEERALGGVCLNEGCVPTKTLLYSAKLADSVKFGEKYGVHGETRLEHSEVVRRKDKVVRTLGAGIRAQMKEAGVTVISARGKLTGRAEGGFSVEAGEVRYLTERVLVATGSSPFIPNIAGLSAALESGFAVTSREALSLKELPESVLIIGAGVIGMEFASYFNSAGCRVTVAELLGQVGGGLDEKLALHLRHVYERKGVEFLMGSKVIELREGTVVVETPDGMREVECAKALLCVGRKPNISDIGLETAGVLIERGAIVTDAALRTNVDGIWAAGDVNGKLMLAHKASREAELAVDDMLGQVVEMDYLAVPSVIYTNPELACVGLSLTDAISAGFDALEVKLPMRFSGRYLAENEGGDSFALLVYEKSTRRVLGSHMAANGAGETIWGMASVIGRHGTLDDIECTVFPHPTVGEVFREAALRADG